MCNGTQQLPWTQCNTNGSCFHESTHIERCGYWKLNAADKHMMNNNLDSDVLSGFYGVHELGKTCWGWNSNTSPDHPKKNPWLTPLHFCEFWPKCWRIKKLNWFSHENFYLHPILWLVCFSANSGVFLVEKNHFSHIMLLNSYMMLHYAQGMQWSVAIRPSLLSCYMLHHKFLLCFEVYTRKQQPLLFTHVTQLVNYNQRGWRKT